MTKAFFWAIVIHLFIIANFTFLFSPLNESKKPNIMFLGRILDKMDIFPTLTSTTQRTENSKREDILNSHLNSSQSPFHSNFVKKPSFLNPSRGNEKNLPAIELTQARLPIVSTQKSTSTEEIMRELKIEPYKPIKLRTE